MQLSIIIVNWNTKKLLNNCLKSIFCQTYNFSLEVFVVDNASTDDSVRMIKNNFPQVHLISNKENVGFAKANNQALREAKGDYLLLLNPDTVINRDTLINSLKFFTYQKDASIMGCKINNPDGSNQPSCRRFPTVISQTLIMLKLHNLFPKMGPLKEYFLLDFDFTKRQKVDQVMGAFFMLTRKTLTTLGFLDDGYWIWYEEVDYCKRAALHGLPVYYNPEASIIHHKAQSFNQVIGPKKQNYLNRSAIRYFYKYEGKLKACWLIIIYPLSISISVFSYLFSKYLKKYKRADL